MQQTEYIVIYSDSYQELFGLSICKNPAKYLSSEKKNLNVLPLGAFFLCLCMRDTRFWFYDYNRQNGRYYSTNSGQLNLVSIRICGTNMFYSVIGFLLSKVHCFCKYENYNIKPVVQNLFYS